jgi:hypothetical protein
VADAISAKDILEWTFVLAALDLGALGFIYNAYVSVKLQQEDFEAIPIARPLKFFCRALVVVLAVLNLVSVVTAFQNHVTWQVWVIIVCLLTMTVFSAVLAYWMD